MGMFKTSNKVCLLYFAVQLFYIKLCSVFSSVLWRDKALIRISLHSETNIPKIETSIFLEG